MQSIAAGHAAPWRMSTHGQQRPLSSWAATPDRNLPPQLGQGTKFYGVFGSTAEILDTVALHLAFEAKQGLLYSRS
jgi:hypothetical protein